MVVEWDLVVPQEALCLVEQYLAVPLRQAAGSALDLLNLYFARLDVRSGN